MVLLAQGSRVSAFVLPQSTQVRTKARAVGGHRSRSFSNLKALYMAEEDESLDNQKIDETKGFDGEGFAGYLAPYALALLASIGVTWAFVKFVLLDY